MQREEMAKLRVLSSNHWDLNFRDLPAAPEGRQARSLEVDGLPSKPARLVHFHPGVGGLCALSNPSVNTTSTERQPSGFEPAAFSISRPICSLLHTSPSLNWVPGNATPARAAGFRAGRWEIWHQENHACCQRGRHSAPWAPEQRVYIYVVTCPE